MKGWTLEDHEQYKVVQYTDIQYPHALYLHVPNEGNRSLQWNIKMKKLGLKKGATDLLYFDQMGVYNGLAIEMKSENGRLKKEQKDFLWCLEARRWKIAVCWSFEEAKKVLDIYYSLPEDCYFYFEGEKTIIAKGIKIWNNVAIRHTELRSSNPTKR